MRRDVDRDRAERADAENETAISRIRRRSTTALLLVLGPCLSQSRRRRLVDELPWICFRAYGDDVEAVTSRPPPATASRQALNLAATLRKHSSIDERRQGKASPRSEVAATPWKRGEWRRACGFEAKATRRAGSGRTDACAVLSVSAGKRPMHGEPWTEPEVVPP
jgi:hypothetical protein